MSFDVYTAVPSSAVASGGTIAFTIPAGSLGLYKFNGGHALIARGLSSTFSFPNDFTVSFSGTTATVTYNGSTPIPAGTQVTLQLDKAGRNNSYAPLTDVSGVQRGARLTLRAIELGAPAAASATAVVNAATVANSTAVTLTTPVSLDVPRGLAYVSSSASDTAVTITAFGTDEYGVAMSEIVTLNGTTAVNGKKAFAKVTGYKASAAPVGTLSIGTQAGVLGLPAFLAGGTSAGSGFVLRESVDGAVAGTAGTFVGGDMTKATTSTGDVRGTYTPNSAPNASRTYQLFVAVEDEGFLGVPQA